MPSAVAACMGMLRYHAPGIAYGCNGGKDDTMAPAPGRLDDTVKRPVQVRTFPEASAAVDAFAAELSQQSYGAAFSRAEALWIAAMEWLKERQARGTPAVYLSPADK